MWLQFLGSHSKKYQIILTVLQNNVKTTPTVCYYKSFIQWGWVGGWTKIGIANLYAYRHTYKYTPPPTKAQQVSTG